MLQYKKVPNNEQKITMVFKLLSGIPLKRRPIVEWHFKNLT